MAYIFKEKITYSDYKLFLKNYDYLSFMQEHLWAKTKNYHNYRIVGVYNDDEICATALLLFEKTNNSKKILIPNGYNMDLNNFELLEFFTKSLKKFAEKNKVYAIEVYPYISNKNINHKNIHNNFINLEYQYNEEYLDYTKNIVINLKNNEQFIDDILIDKIFRNKHFYQRKGITFELTNEFFDIERFNNLNDDKVNTELLKNLILYYKDRVKMIFIKFDLSLYKEYLINNDYDKNIITKISNLIENHGDIIDIGCSLYIIPYNRDGIKVAELLFTKVKKAFKKLDIENAIILSIMESLKENNIDYLKISNNDLDISKYVNRYNAIAFKFIGSYTLIINKFKYYLYYDIKRR